MIHLRLKKFLTTVRRAISNSQDIKRLCFDNNVQPGGVLIVIHESQELGASLLALRIASEMVQQGSNIYIVSRQFGRLNKEYSKIAPTQIVLFHRAYAQVCKKLSKKGYTRALLITAATGDLTKITKCAGFETISMIHELDKVIEMLHLEKATKEMLKYSDKVIFSTTFSKNPILKLLGEGDKKKFYVKPQGTYFIKPSDTEMERQRQILLGKFPEIIGKTIVAGIGNTTNRKGFDIFVQTAWLKPELLFVWAGPKEKYYDEVKNTIKFPVNFLYLGKLSPTQLSAVYSVASVYLMSSRFDTLPSTIYEALLFEVPVIGASNSGGIVDIINANNGYLTADADANLFTMALSSMSAIKNHIEPIDNSFQNYVRFILGLF